MTPNCGAGSRDTRKDAVRWRSVHDANCVTRSVCREIWAGWVVSDDDNVKRLQDCLADTNKTVHANHAAFMALGARLGYGGTLWSKP